MLALQVLSYHAYQQRKLLPACPVAFFPLSMPASEGFIVDGPTSATMQAPKTLSGLTLISGKIPNNAARNFMRCCAEGCTKDGARGCAARMCGAHCSTEFTGVKCSLHKGTKAQPASRDDIQAETSSTLAQTTPPPIATQGSTVSSKANAPATSPKKGRGGRPSGPRPSRSYGFLSATISM